MKIIEIAFAGYTTKPPNNKKEQKMTKLFKTLVTFLLGLAFMIMMIIAATNRSVFITSICGALSVVLLVATGIMLEEKP